ncbi:MAG: GDP-mannose 4,6-dehydratase [Thermomicrobiaceae bacterium]
MLLTRILITGASGFVGRHLVDHLLRQGESDIIGLSSRKRPEIEGARLLVCDLRDADLTRRVLEHHRPEVIYHLAGQSHVPRAFADPADTLITNAVGQINLFEGCRNAGIDPVILSVGSSEVYGAVSADSIPIDESQPLRPNNPYASSKAAQDLYAAQYFASYGMKIVRVRSFNHVGPGQTDRFVVASFARQIAEVEAGLADPVVLVGNLEPIRDFLDVRDVVRAYYLVAKSEFSGEVFNVASGRGVRIREVLDMLVGAADCEIDVRADPERVRPSEVPEFRGDASKFHDATGWMPEYSLEQTVRDVLNDWRRRIR